MLKSDVAEAYQQVVFSPNIRIDISRDRLAESQTGKKFPEFPPSISEQDQR